MTELYNIYYIMSNINYILAKEKSAIEVITEFNV